MKRIFYLFVFLPLLATAQPSGYYNNALGLNGQALEDALHTIISNGYVQLTYTPDLWNAYPHTDKKPNGKVWDIYSDVPGGTPAYEYTFTTNQCGNGSNHENSCYNREHSWPQSKFGSHYPMYSDLWIVYPTDYYVNGQRGDLPYGKVGTATKTFTNGTKIGNNTYTGAPAGNCFEPIDSFKGDLARSYFYIVTRYLADSSQFIDWEMATKATLKPWAIQMLLEWHHMDPVSSKEIMRNDSVYAQQNNRNPFIDYPQFADCIWGNGDCTSLSVPTFAGVVNKVYIYPNPAHGKVTIDWQKLSPDEVLAVDILNMQGQVLYNQPVQSSSLKTAEVETGDWAKGIYLLEVRTKRGMQVQKMIVE
ncbi:endonuclease [Chitinophagaceae bacterium MMS25-I14]